MNISIVIAVRNMGDEVTHCLESIDRQSQKPFEVVVVNDRSTDNTGQHVAAFFSQNKPYRFQIIEGPGRGIAAARNAGNLAATGEIIYVLDAGDSLEENALEIVAGAFDKSPIAVLFGNCIITTKSMKLGTIHRYRPFPSDSTWSRRKVLGSFFVPFKHSAMAYRRNEILAMGGYDESLRKQVDVDLLLRFFQRGSSIQHINHVLCRYRKHPDRMSQLRWKNFWNWRRLIIKYEPSIFWRSLCIGSRAASEFIKFLLEAPSRILR